MKPVYSARPLPLQDVLHSPQGSKLAASTTATCSETAASQLNVVGLADKVYGEMKDKARLAILQLIDKEREGDQIDRALLKNVLDIFIEVGMNTMDAYEGDFEVALLNETGEFYKRKAAAWIQVKLLELWPLSKVVDGVAFLMGAAAQKQQGLLSEQLVWLILRGLVACMHAGCLSRPPSIVQR